VTRRPLRRAFFSGCGSRRQETCSGVAAVRPPSMTCTNLLDQRETDIGKVSLCARTGQAHGALPRVAGPRVWGRSCCRDAENTAACRTPVRSSGRGAGRPGMSGRRFNEGAYTARIEFRVEDADRVNFEKYAVPLGFSADDFGREFTTESGTFRIVGFSPNRKYALDVVDTSTGKRCGYVPRFALDALAARKKQSV
jgi:hypothetical protein